MRTVRLDELVGRRPPEVLSAHPGDFSRVVPGVSLPWPTKTPAQELEDLRTAPARLWDLCMGQGPN